MSVTTKQYSKKPLFVEAVRVTRRNFADLTKWCDGKVEIEGADHHKHPGAKYIKIDAHNPLNARQTKAFVGDWILQSERGFKVYTHQSFCESFDLVVELEHTPVYPREDGPHTIIGPECFAMKDGSVLCWKGTNYVPQGADRRVETEATSLDDDIDCCVPQ